MKDEHYNCQEPSVLWMYTVHGMPNIMLNRTCFYYVIMFLLCFILLVSFFESYFLPNQKNPTAVWLRFIGMHKKNKTWFLKLFKNRVTCFCKWTLHTHTHTYIYTHTLTDHFIRYTLLVPGWNPFCLQNCPNSSWHRFNKVLETLLRYFGPY